MIVLHIYKTETILWLVTVHTYFSLIFLQHLPRDQEQKNQTKTTVRDDQLTVISAKFALHLQLLLQNHTLHS